LAKEQINYIPQPLGPPRLDDCEDHQLGISLTDTNPEVLESRDLAADSRITCTTLHVKYGTFKGVNAGLIVFHCELYFPPKPSGWNRIKSATIKVEFTQTIPFGPTKLPKIRAQFPQSLRSAAVTPSSIHVPSHADVTVQPPSPANFGSIGVGRSVGNDFTRTHYTMVHNSIMAYSNGGIGRQCLNTAVWGIAENGAEKKGVTKFRGAIIIELPEDSASSKFYAKFTIKAKQACKTRQRWVSLIETFGAEDTRLVCFDTKLSFEAGGLSDDLEKIDIPKLIALPPIDTLPPGY
jgi:hypothetical protein